METGNLNPVILESMAKACAYSCHQCHHFHDFEFIREFSELGEKDIFMK